MDALGLLLSLLSNCCWNTVWTLRVDGRDDRKTSNREPSHRSQRLSMWIKLQISRVNILCCNSSYLEKKIINICSASPLLMLWVKFYLICFFLWWLWHISKSIVAPNWDVFKCFHSRGPQLKTCSFASCLSTYLTFCGPAPFPLMSESCPCHNCSSGSHGKVIWGKHFTYVQLSAVSLQLVEINSGDQPVIWETPLADRPQ